MPTILLKTDLQVSQSQPVCVPMIASVTFVSLVLFWGIAGTADDKSKSRTNRARSQASNARQIQLIRNDLDLPLQGITKPVKLAELNAQIPGEIAKINVVEGQWVDEGTILGVIENSTSLAAVEVARVEAAQRGFIEQANSDWKLEYQKFSRLQSLVNSSATSSLELQEKSALLAQKKATLLQAEESNKLAQAKLEQAIANLKKHNLVAPFKGQVVQIHGKKGTVPQSADPIITLVDLSELEVEMHVPLNRFGQIKQGDSIQLVAFAPLNRELSATVVSVSPLINPTSSTFRCLFRIANPERSFPAGFIVSLKSE